MSAYSTNETQFKDKAMLLCALAEMGFDASKVEVYDTPQSLYDFQGRLTHYIDSTGDKAEIIIRRKYVGGAANDLGFTRGSDGKYKAIISAYDSTRYNQTWLGKLTASYARQSILQTAKRQGLRYAGSIQKNGKTQMQFVQA